jgi:hypothetical protein
LSLLYRSSMNLASMGNVGLSHFSSAGLGFAAVALSNASVSGLHKGVPRFPPSTRGSPPISISTIYLALAGAHLLTSSAYSSIVSCQSRICLSCFAPWEESLSQTNSRLTRNDRRVRG